MKVCIQCDPVFNGGRLFSNDLPLNRDNCLEPFRELKNAIENCGGTLSTSDQEDPHTADVVIDLDSYGKENIGSRTGRSFLIALESPIVRPENYVSQRYHAYDKVFTWHRGINNSKIVPINIPVPLRPMNPGKSFHDRNILCLISGNKNSRHPKSLYQERIHQTRWFERNHPTQWGLYGVGWEIGSSLIPYKWQRGPLKQVAEHFRKEFPSYKGAPLRKSDVYTSYRFALAYENAEGFPGYVTEKIFDPMLSGCVPIYRGAPDIKRIVPEECFIEGSRFSSPRKLQAHLVGMTEERWEDYRKAIRQYLSSSSINELSSTRFSEIVVKVIWGASK